MIDELSGITEYSDLTSANADRAATVRERAEDPPAGHYPLADARGYDC